MFFFTSKRTRRNVPVPVLNPDSPESIPGAALISTAEHVGMPRLRDIGIIALPMVVSQASETVNHFVDRLFLSNLGKLYIAGSMTGGLMAIWASSLFVGTFMFVNALVAQHHGAGKNSGCARATAQALRLAFMSWPLLLLAIPLVRFLLGRLGHGAEQIEIEMTYLSILMYGAIFNLLNIALTGFFIGLGRTRIVMLANVAGMLINVPANWLLIFGRLGFPALGIRGAAIGSLCGSAVITIIFLAIYFSGPYRRGFNTAGELGFDKALMKKLLEYGTPAGGEFFLNISAFNLFVQLMHSYSADTAAAVTIALNYDMLAFVPLMGIGFAATTLTGRYIGAKNIRAAERSIRLNLYTAWSYAAIFVLLFSFGAGFLAKVFTSRLEGGGVTVLPMARVMLRLAALYVLADATQVIFAGALRGAGDTKFVMWLSVIIHWVFVGLIFYVVKIALLPPLVAWYIFIGFALSLGIAMYLRYRLGKWRRLSLVD